MANPNRGGRGGNVNGRGGPPANNNFALAPQVDQSPPAPPVNPTNGVNSGHTPAGRGFPRGGRGGFVPGFRGGRGFAPNGERGRGGPRGGFRGRGRGSFAAPLPS